MVAAAILNLEILLWLLSRLGDFPHIRQKSRSYILGTIRCDAENKVMQKKQGGGSHHLDSRKTALTLETLERLPTYLTDKKVLLRFICHNGMHRPHQIMLVNLHVIHTSVTFYLPQWNTSAPPNHISKPACYSYITFTVQCQLCEEPSVYIRGDLYAFDILQLDFEKQT